MPGRNHTWPSPGPAGAPGPGTTGIVVAGNPTSGAFPGPQVGLPAAPGTQTTVKPNLGLLDAYATGNVPA